MTRPNPQLIQLATSDTSETSKMACPGVRASFAMASRMRRKKTVVASTQPVTRTRTICIENWSRLQKPLPRYSIVATGAWPSTSMPAANTGSVSSRTRTKGSGSHLSTRRTDIEVARCSVVCLLFAFLWCRCRPVLRNRRRVPRSRRMARRSGATSTGRCGERRCVVSRVRGGSTFVDPDQVVGLYI